MRARLAAVLVAIAITWMLALPALAATAEKCASAKLRAAGRKTNGLVKCHASALQRSRAVDPDCVARVESKFAGAWARIEGKGGCATTGDLDEIEAQVDADVADLVAALAPTTTTSTTTTPTSTCPPTTAFYCGQFCDSFALCPGGQTCTTNPGGGCACVGPAVPCGNVAGNLCRWGECPPGQGCLLDAGSSQCPPACHCVGG